MSAENTFKRLGMGEYESRTLAALLMHHDATAEQIADSAEIPYTKVYHVLTTLEKQGLIRATLERPKKYRPINPEDIVNTFLEKKEDELKDLKKQVKEDVRELEKTYEQGESYQGKERVWYLPNEKAVWEGVTTFLKTAKKYAIVSVDKETWEYALSTESVLNALISMNSKKIRSRGILPRSFDMNSSKIGKKALLHLSSDMTDIRIIDDSKIVYHVLVVDDEKIGFSFRNFKSGRLESGMVLEDKSIATGTRQYFDQLWNQALPVEKTIREEAKRALKALEAKE